MLVDLLNKLNKFIFKIVVFTASLTFAQAALAVSSGITYHGRILDSSNNPIVDSNVQFKMQIRTPDAGSCLMYEEVQAKDLSTSLGSFSITINDGTGSRTDTSGVTFDRIFANYGSLSFAPATCSSGTGNWTPNSSDGRTFVVSFKTSTMSSWEPMPAQAINFSPFAIESKQVAGFPGASLFRVENGSGPQTVTSLSPSQANILLNLAQGTTQYVTTTANGAALPAFASDPTTPIAGDVWYDSTNKVVKYYDGTSVQIVGSGGAVSGNSITSGTIGGSTSMNTSGSVTAASVSSTTDSTQNLQLYNTGNTHKVTVTVPASLAADYPLQLPGALPATNGLVLSSTTAGVTSWAQAYTNGGNSWAGPASLGTNDNNTLAFKTNNATAMTIDTSGKIGIGITSPTAPLQISSTNTATSGNTYGLKITPTYNQASGTAGNTDLLVNRTETAVGSGTQNLLDLQVAGTSKFSVANNGNVLAGFVNVNGLQSTNGVTSYIFDGTPYASTSATLAAPTSIAMSSVNTDSIDSEGASIDLRVANTAGKSQEAYIGAISNTGAGVYTPSIVIGQKTGATAYAERMRIDASGNVGIGTTSPDSSLVVSGTPAGSNNTVLFSNGAATTATASGVFAERALMTATPTSASTGVFMATFGESSFQGAFGAGAKAVGIFGRGGTSFGTLGTAIGGEFMAQNVVGTVTNSYGILVDSNLNAGGTSTNNAGLAISSQTAGSNNTLLLLGTQTIPTGNFGLYQSGGANNYFSGNVGIGTTNPGASFDLHGAGTASPLAKFGTASVATPDVVGSGFLFGEIFQPSFHVTGNTSQTWAYTTGTKYNVDPAVTVGNTYELYLDTPTKSGTGTITNAYGLYVNTPTVGINSYPAVFMGGNVGIGTTTPAGNLAIDNAGHNATICLNGTCTSTLGGGGGGSQSSTSNFVLNSNSDGTGSDGGFNFQSNGSNILQVSNSGAITTYGNITGNSALAVAAGGTNQNLALLSSGTGAVNVGTGNGTGFSVLDPGVAAANYVTVKGAATGNAPVIGTAGSDININLVLTPKGTGNVGIGTATPNNAVQINGNTPLIQVTDTTNSLTGYFGVYTNAARISVNRNLNTATNFDPTKAAAGMDMISSAGSSSINFYTTNTNNASPSQAMVIQGNGNVGIGTTTPQAKLAVVGDATNIEAFDAQAGTGNPYAFVAWDSSRVQSVAIRPNLGGFNLLSSDGFATDLPLALSGREVISDFVLNNGNVGIGTTTPATTLHTTTSDAVTNAVTNVVRLEHQSSGTPAANYGTGLVFGGKDSTTANQDMARIDAIWTTATHASRASALRFSTLTAAGALTERMRIDGAGNIGIGTTDTSQATVYIEAGTSQSPLDIDYNAPNSSYDDGIFLNNSAASADGAVLVLSHSPGATNTVNDELGKIEFGGNDSSGQLWMSEIRSNITNTTHATATSTLSFATTNNGTKADRMTILGTGNVGIGTTTPAGNLAIDNAGHNATLCLNGTCSTTLGGGGGSQASTSNFVFNSNSDGTGSDGGFNFQSNGSNILQVSNSGAITTYGNITGNSAFAVAAGGTNQNLALLSSGTGAVNVGTGNGTGFSVLDPGAASANYVTVKGAATGNAPVIGTAGSDTNINLVLTPKGTGNVGIGTTSPPALLSVGPTSNFQVDGSGNITVGSINQSIGGGTSVFNSLVDIYISDVTLYTSTSITAAAPPGVSINSMNSQPTANTASTIAIGGNSGGMAYISSIQPSSGTSAALAFSQKTGASSYSERMRIDTNGNVGIGTTSPQSRLDVTGSLTGYNLNAAVNIAQPYSSSSASATIPSAVSNGNINLTNANQSDGNSSLIQMVSSNSNLNVQSSYIGSVTVAGAGHTPAMVFGQQTGANAYSERMRIDQNGNVGIGTTTPSFKLSVASGVKTTSQILASIGTTEGAWQGLYFMNETNTGTAIQSAEFGVGNNALSLNPAGGNVGVGTTSPTSTLQVNGTANATTFLMNGSSSAEAAKVTNAAEVVNVSATAATGTVNFYVASGAVQYYTSNASANWTLNWAWSAGTSFNTAVAVGESVTTTFLVTQGATAYYPSAFTIDGTSVTPKWLGGSAPTSGDASSIDVYTCTIIKTANATYTVLCGQAQYK